MKKIFLLCVFYITIIALYGCSPAEVQSAMEQQNEITDVATEVENTNSSVVVSEIIGATIQSETMFFRIQDLDNNERFFSSRGHKHMIVYPETIIPHFLGEIDELLFPAQLTGTLLRKETGFETPFNLEGVTDYASLILKVRTSIDDVSSGMLDGFRLLLPTPLLYDATHQRFRSHEDINEISKSGEWYWFHFGASAYGLTINYQGSGFIPTIYFDSDRSVLRFHDVHLLSFEPTDKKLISAMLPAQALDIVEKTQVAGSTVYSMQLVYARNPNTNSFGEENYSLCWQIEGNATYYVDCETGDLWF